VKNCLARGIVIDLEEAENAVYTFRDDNPETVQFWKLLGNAAIEAVQAGIDSTNAVKCKCLSLYIRDRWLCIRLPSGRELRYFRPRVRMVDRWGNGKLVPQLSYQVEVKRRLVWETTYGGKLTENVVQAIARDVMIHSCFKAERQGYPIIGRIHDELIALVAESFGSAAEMEEILRVRPKWASNAPINAEGWEDTRYRV